MKLLPGFYSRRRSADMDRVLLDTNVLLDFVMVARPEHETVTTLVGRLLEGDADLCIVATSLKDVYYILTRTDGESVARQVVESLMVATRVLSVDDECCRQAIGSSEPDFEDGIIRAAAEIERVSFIITRDQAAFIGSRVPSISPADALRELPAT